MLIFEQIPCVRIIVIEGGSIYINEGSPELTTMNEFNFYEINKNLLNYLPGKKKKRQKNFH